MYMRTNHNRQANPRQSAEDIKNADIKNADIENADIENANIKKADNKKSAFRRAGLPVCLLFFMLSLCQTVSRMPVAAASEVNTDSGAEDFVWIGDHVELEMNAFAPREKIQEDEHVVVQEVQDSDEPAMAADRDQSNLTLHPDEPASAMNMNSETIRQINHIREAHGISPLQLSPALYLSAVQRAGELPVLFSHTRPDGNPWYTAGDGTAMGENLAMGFHNASDVVAAWMESPSHRDNLLSPDYTMVSLASITADNGVIYQALELA